MVKLILISILLVGISSCATTEVDESGFKLYELDEFSIPVPIGWEANTDITEEGIMISAIDKKDGDNLFVENFHIRKYVGVVASMDEILIENKASIRKAYDGEIQEFELPDAKTKNKVLQIEVETQGLTMNAWAVYYFTNKNLYVFNFICESKYYDKYFPVFKYIAENIEFR